MCESKSTEIIKITFSFYLRGMCLDFGESLIFLRYCQAENKF